jgi:hypothetical protein
MSDNSVQMSVIYRWPLDIYNNQGIGLQTANSRYVLAAVGLGAAYWWGGGLPGQGQDLMTHVSAYLVGGVAVYGAAMVTASK